MSLISYSLSRFSELTRDRGLGEALTRAWNRATADVTLYARQAWWSLAGGRLPSEQRVLSKTVSRWHTLNDLVDHLCHKDSPAFLFYTADKEKLIAHWRELYPHSVRRTLAQAEAASNLRFDLLGAKYDFQQTGEIDWHLDVVSGRRWPMDYIEKIDRWMWSDQRLGDYKPIWELNRHQHFTALGRAYWLTDEERYAEVCASQMLSWIHNNPYLFGINWYSALEVGIRLISWGLAFHYFRGSRRFADMVGKAFIQSLYQQGDFLQRHLTLDWPGRNNHIIGEAAALAYIGALFDEFAPASEWRETGLCIVEQEVARQTHSDGVTREQSPAYHCFVLDFVLLLVVLARRGALRPSPSLENLAEKMLEYAMFAITPARDLPALGDADDGRGFVLSTCAAQESWREALAIGAVLFQRPDFKFVAENFGEGPFWLLGEPGRTTFEAMMAREPGQVSVSFPQGGHFIIRDDWTPESDYALLRCGEFGLAGEGYCAHSHCDLLSPVLWIKGKPLLVDSGTYTYHGSWRDRFRLTTSHNTVMVDGKEQAIPVNLFSWRQVPTAHCEVWEEHRVVGSLATLNGVTFRRELAHPYPGQWCLTDSFVGTGRHRIVWAFHLAPGLVPIPLPQDKGIRIVGSAGAEWVIVFQVPDITFTIKDGWVSHLYGKQIRNKVIHAQWQGQLGTGGESFVWRFGLRRAYRGMAYHSPAQKSTTDEL